EERRVRARVDPVTVDVGRLRGRDLDLELGLAELRHEEAVRGDGPVLAAAPVREIYEVVAGRRVAREREGSGERAELVRMAALPTELLAARAADGDVERRVGRGQAVPRVVVGAEDGLVVDRLAGAVDRAVHVDVTDPLARVVLARDPELVGRGALLPARAHHRVPAARVYPHEVRAVAVVAEDRRRHLERREPVRVGAQLGGIETGSGPAEEGVLER